VVSFGGGSSFFGYTGAVRRDGVLVLLTGKNVRPLQLGQRVRLLGDSRGYISSGFKPDEEVTITAFRMPFDRGSTDYIVEVTNGPMTGWVKPSSIAQRRPE